MNASWGRRLKDSSLPHEVTASLTALKIEIFLDEWLRIAKKSVKISATSFRPTFGSFWYTRAEAYPQTQHTPASRSVSLCVGEQTLNQAVNVLAASLATIGRWMISIYQLIYSETADRSGWEDRCSFVEFWNDDGGNDDEQTDYDRKTASKLCCGHGVECMTFWIAATKVS